MPGKKVQCSYCSKVMRSDNLKNHIKTHDRVDETSLTRPWEPSIQSSTFGTPPQDRKTNKSKVFEQLRAADTTPLDFHFVEENKPSMSRVTEEKGSQNAMSDTDEEEVREVESIIDDIIDDTSAAEDDEDVIMDAGVWHTIALYTEENGISLLVSFKFFFQLAEAIDHDATIKGIMDTVYAIRDDDDISFKEALDHALEKRKFLIWKTLKDNESSTVEHLNVWKMISDEMKEHTLDEASRILRCYILLSRSIKRDEIFHSVKEMIQECEDDIDAMSHDEALSYAIDQKSSVIAEAVRRAVAGGSKHVSSSSVQTSYDGDKNTSTRRKRKVEA